MPTNTFIKKSDFNFFISFCFRQILDRKLKIAVCSPHTTLLNGRMKHNFKVKKEKNYLHMTF